MVATILLPDISLLPPLTILLLALLATTLLLLRKPRFLVDLYNSPPPLALTLLFWPLALPSMLANLVLSSASPRHTLPPCPPHQHLLTLPAYVLAQQIKSGELTSVELTALCIARIKEHNHHLNAIVVERFEQALVEAQAADLCVQNNQVQPHQLLFGVPIVVKECMELKGLPFTAGIKALEGTVGQKDSTTMSRVKKDGMIIVGTTNISEGCMFHESNNGVTV